MFQDVEMIHSNALSFIKDNRLELGLTETNVSDGSGNREVKTNARTYQLFCSDEKMQVSSQEH